jgi:putative membrane protein
MMEGMGFGMGFGWLVWLLLIGIIIWAVKMVMDSQSHNTAENNTQSKALDILQERFAKGEIDSQEYEAKRRQLIA